MPVAEFIETYWPVLFTALVIMVWAVRVEQMVKKVVSDVNEMKERRKEDLAATSASRVEVHDTLVEIQRDIKNILTTVGGKK